MTGKNKDNSVNITAIVYFNGFVITNIYEGVTFMYELVLESMSFEELRVEFCQTINVGSQRRENKILFTFQNKEVIGA